MKSIVPTGKQLMWVTAIAVLIACGAFAFGIRVKAKPFKSASSSVPAKAAHSRMKSYFDLSIKDSLEKLTPLPLLQSQNTGFRQGIRIWVQTDGIRPAVIHTVTARLRVNVENSTNSGVSVVIDSQAPNSDGHALVVQVTENERRNHKDIDLAPGTYVFYESAHPDVKGSIIVSANN